MQTVGVRPGIVESMHACLLTGKDKETEPFVSPLLMPYLCKPRFASKQLNHFPKVSKWVITKPSQTLCGFKILRTRKKCPHQRGLSVCTGSPHPHPGAHGRWFHVSESVKQPLWDRCTGWERKLKLKTKISPWKPQRCRQRTFFKSLWYTHRKRAILH